MTIYAFLRDAEMELLDKLGTCQTKEELDNALTQEGIDHTAADLGPLFAALTPMRSPSAADDWFSNLSSASIYDVEWCKSSRKGQGSSFGCGYGKS